MRISLIALFAGIIASASSFSVGALQDPIPPTSKSATSQDDRIEVFIKSKANAGGFTDPSKDRQDSVKDLIDKTKDSKLLQIVNRESDARIVLEVLDRTTKRETNAWTALGGSRQNKSYLTVRMTVGDYQTEFEGESGSKGMLKGYGDAAGKVVKQLEAWVKANREKLSTLK